MQTGRRKVQSSSGQILKKQEKGIRVSKNPFSPLWDPKEQVPFFLSLENQTKVDTVAYANIAQACSMRTSVLHIGQYFKKRSG